MIFHALQEIPAVHAAYVEVRAASDLSDEITVVVGGGYDGGHQINKQIVENTLQACLRVRPEIVVKKQADVLAVMGKDGSRKLKRFFDFRL